MNIRQTAETPAAAALPYRGALYAAEDGAAYLLAKGAGTAATRPRRIRRSGTGTAPTGARRRSQDRVLAAVYFSARALDDIDRLFDFIAEHDPASASRAAQRIVDATRILRDHPLIGRPVRGDIRELVISSGRTRYVALYRLRRGVRQPRS